MRIGFVGALALPLLFVAPAGVATAAAQDNAVVSQFEHDRYSKTCRRQVRRAYGPARGRHAGSIRLAAIQRCMMSGGKVS